MRNLISMSALLALTALIPAARAADKDFNGRWDLIVHNNPNCTVTCAWWLEVTGAGTPELKGTFVGFPDGSLHELPDLTIKDGVLHYAWDRPAGTGRGGRAPIPAQHIDYEVRYVSGKLEGATSGGNTVTFTGERAPEINKHDDATWVKGKPITLFNGKDLTGWTGIRTENAEGWTVENGVQDGELARRLGRMGSGAAAF